MDAFKIGSLIIAGISAVCSIVKVINDNNTFKYSIAFCYIVFIG